MKDRGDITAAIIALILTAGSVAFLLISVYSL